MKINRILPVEIPKIEGSPKQFGINTLKADVFEKSKTPSFGKSSYLDSLIDDIIGDVTALVLESIDEEQLQLLIDALSDKKIQAQAAQFKNINMSEFISYIFSDIGSTSDFINNLLNETGMNNFYAFKNYLRVYNSAPDSRRIFSGQAIESLKIYSQLKIKDDFAKYGELLLYIYNLNLAQKDEEQKVDLNEITAFLNQIGLNKLKDFDERFACLKSDFNDYKNISDKYDAIVYLMMTYPEKIRYVNEILETNPQGKGVSAEKIYNAHTDIIDYLYEKNDGNSLEPLGEIIDQISSDKIKKPALKQISPYFNEFSSPEDKLDFYRFLNEFSLTPDDINALAKNPVVSDSSILSNIANKNAFVREISSQRGINESQALNAYKNYSDLLNAIYSKNDADNTRLRIFFNIADMFKAKNSQEMLVLYNNINGIKKKSVTSDEFKEFIDLMAFCSSDKILKDAKAKKVNPVDILSDEKQKFLAVKQEITDFILSDDIGFYLGLNPRAVYLKYRDSINKNPFSVSAVLENIIKLNIENSTEYAEKTAKLQELEGFFEDRKTLFEFVENANIKFDASSDDEEYINNCKQIFNILKSSSSKEEYQKRLSYIIESDFLPQSKNSLSEFFDMYKDKQELTQILSVIADKKVTSVSEFNDFIKKYQDEDGKYDNILSILASLGDDVDFKEFERILDLIQTEIKKTFVPVNVNNTNINSIDIPSLKGKNKLSEEEITEIINLLSGADANANFISKLSKSFIKTDKSYSRFDIANEIVNKITGEDDLYNNIIAKLKIDRQTMGLDEKSSDYIYMRAIAETMPAEFIDFINSKDWISISEDSEITPNLSLHARLRLLDRFALQHCESIEDLYSDTTKNYIKDILRAIYMSKDSILSCDEQQKRIITHTQLGTDNIKTVFAQNGKMITIIAKGR